MNISELIQNTDSLPPAPEILPKLVEIMRDPDADSNDVVSLISTDPAIIAGVLKLSNSAAYSPAQPVTDLNDAVAMLGIQTVYRIVNMVSGSEFLDGSLSSMAISSGGLWEHSLAVALMMDQIAKGLSEVEGLPYTLGILHDVGKLLFHLGLGEEYVKVFKRVETERISITKAENQTFGFDHALAGSTMLEEWNFSPEIFIPIRYQYTPNEAPEFKELAGALHIANWGASVLGCNDGRDSWALEMCEGAIDIDEATIQMAILETKMGLEKAKQSVA
ncbi:HDOD domain-containing protein [Puniceicoccaceae bacterium K14]|nr:HDOD domain-containing protein [Puniceicoccaceae bacterium K14]